MKYDLTKPPTRGARRTLDAFYQALIDAITQTSFERVTVNALCESADYPRATFYNYFDDKYDLLDYAWSRIAAAIGLDDASGIPGNESLPTFFDRFYDLAEKNEALIAAACRFSPPEGYLFSSFRIYIGRVVRSFFEHCDVATHRERAGIPRLLVSEHVANTVMLVLEQRFLRPEGAGQSREETLAQLEYLLGNLLDGD